MKDDNFSNFNQSFLGRFTFLCPQKQSQVPDVLNYSFLPNKEEERKRRGEKIQIWLLWKTQAFINKCTQKDLWNIPLLSNVVHVVN